MENDPKSKAQSETTAQGMYVYRDGLRAARRNRDEIELYRMDGTYDKTEPITVVQKDDVLEIYDEMGNKIGSELLSSEAQTPAS